MSLHVCRQAWVVMMRGTGMGSLGLQLPWGLLLEPVAVSPCVQSMTTMSVAMVFLLGQPHQWVLAHKMSTHSILDQSWLDVNLNYNLIGLDQRST